jgi:hypothetical protein
VTLVKTPAAVHRELLLILPAPVDRLSNKTHASLLDGKVEVSR